MARVKATWKNLTEIRKAINNLPAQNKEAAECLISEISFLHDALEKLKLQIEVDGPVIKTKRGQSEIIKENPALKAYNTSIMRYAQVFKQLTDMLPAPPKEPERDPLLDFIKDE